MFLYINEKQAHCKTYYMIPYTSDILLSWELKYNIIIHDTELKHLRRKM